MELQLNSLRDVLATKASTVALLANKHSPEILMVGGIAALFAGGVFTYRAFLEAEKTIETYKENIEVINEVRDKLNEDESIDYDQQDYQRDLTITTVNAGVNLLRAYVPAILATGLGVGMLFKSRGILSQRNASLIAAYKLVDEAYKQYRERVREELGEDVDRYFRYGKKKDEEFTIVNKSKKEVDFSVSKDEELMVESGHSMYAKFFDDSSPQFKRDNEMNQFFLKTQERFANQQLQARGHVFLNEVYDMLGIPRTKAGAIVGWVSGHGDDHIDFDIYNPYNDWNRDFVNGYNTGALLDFNVDGVIYDLI
jgi:hypothetical protein